MRKIWVKLALVLMIVSASGILVSMLLSIKEMDYHFSFYLQDLSKKHREEIISLVREEYQKENGWGNGVFSKLAALAKVLDLEITLYDKNHQILRMVGNHREGNAQPYSNANTIPITLGNESIGYIYILHNADNSAMSLEEHFQIAHTKAMQWTMLVLLLIASITSIIIARRIVQPIVHMSKAAVSVANGNYSVRVPIPQDQNELSELVYTFNQLITSLQKQEELRKRLTSDIAHELRTPLNTLLAQIEGMIDGVWEASPEHLESTRSEVLRLTRLVSDLDQVVQTEAGAFRISKEELDVSDVAKEIVESMKSSFQRKNILLIPRLERLALVVGDKQRLAQVFSNLLTNSLKHTEPNGEVVVSVEKDRETVLITIQDNGIGIPEEDLPHVFERFYRGDRSRNRERGGSGLGLTIAKGIVEAHQGEIKIESELGKGTIVTIRLPSLRK
ncbi:sensor histidine kinase [Brevibacillus sp. SAFN-007a]|uniref:sensor histidine kinase n=1 Tax=Brevibacillus TaxID=55080 RepID=UPI003F7F7F71